MLVISGDTPMEYDMDEFCESMPMSRSSSIFTWRGLSADTGGGDEDDEDEPSRGSGRG